MTRKRIVLFALAAFAVCTCAQAQRAAGGAGDLLRPEAWRPGPGARPAEKAPEGDGVFFPGAATSAVSRLFWEQPAVFSLAGGAVLELEFYCAQPEAVRGMLLYLKSGEGWYVWSAPLKEGGRQKLFFSGAGAGMEGRPAGLSALSGIRLAVQPARGSFLGLSLLAARVIRPALLVVRPSSSAPNSAEREAGERAAGRVSALLRELGLAHALMNDDETARGLPENVKIIILPYNPHPQQAQKSKLLEHLERGGKLIVFYGADPELAAAMGLRLGEYRAASQPEERQGFSFLKSGPAGVPNSVRQFSTSIRAAYPASRNSRLIAFWHGAGRRSTREPAWLISDRGAWMTHILLPGDEENKQRMLLALLAAFEPQLLQPAAERYADKAVKIGVSAGIRSSIAEILRAAEKSGRSEETAAALPDIYRAHEELRRVFAGRDWLASVAAACELKRRLVELYAAAQPGAKKEFRGVWNHSGLGLGAGRWEETCAVLAENGVTALFPNMLWPGRAHFPSRIMAMSDTAARAGDQLQPCIEAAHKRGLEVHAWKVCWRLDWAPPETRETMRRAGRCQVSGDGATLNWLCPSLPENEAYELEAIRELFGKYDVDGLHLDYIRYPDRRACVCGACRRAFEKDAGRAAAAWPADVLPGGRLANEFADWRARRMTEFVAKAAREARSLKPSVKISAAVYSRYPECAAGVGQDWMEWLRRGHVDFVCPMNYIEEPGAFSETLASQFALAGEARGKIMPGLGVTASESRLAADMAIWQIQEARRQGAAGVMIFDLNALLLEETLPLLRLGVFK